MSAVGHDRDVDPSLTNLPDGVIALICKILMVLDPMTLIVSAPNICHSWRVVCSNQISLILKAGWAYKPSPGRAYTSYYPTRSAMSNVVKRFRWIKRIALPEVTRWQPLANGDYLEHLDLSWGHDVTDDTVEAVAADCRGLKCINLGETPKITNTAIRALAAGCSGLKRLILKGCNISDESIKALAAGCRVLEHLDLNRCGEITDVSVEALSVGCSGLKHLNLKFCDNIFSRIFIT